MAVGELPGGSTRAARSAGANGKSTSCCVAGRNRRPQLEPFLTAKIGGAAADAGPSPEPPAGTAPVDPSREPAATVAADLSLAPENAMGRARRPDRPAPTPPPRRMASTPPRMRSSSAPAAARARNLRNQDRSLLNEEEVGALMADSLGLAGLAGRENPEVLAELVRLWKLAQDSHSSPSCARAQKTTSPATVQELSDDDLAELALFPLSKGQTRRAATPPAQLLQEPSAHTSPAVSAPDEFVEDSEESFVRSPASTPPCALAPLPLPHCPCSTALAPLRAHPAVVADTSRPSAARRKTHRSTENSTPKSSGHCPRRGPPSRPDTAPPHGQLPLARPSQCAARRLSLLWPRCRPAARRHGPGQWARSARRRRRRRRTKTMSSTK